jgi:hypothetical protein
MARIRIAKIFGLSLGEKNDLRYLGGGCMGRNNIRYVSWYEIVIGFFWLRKGTGAGVL